MSRVLLLSGGAFRGAVQMPVIDELMARHHYDAVYGVSVGALNGILFAQDQLKLGWRLWRGINGVSSFLKMSIWPFNGLYSMKPMRRTLERYARLDKIKTPFTAGVVSLTNKQYYNLCTTDMVRDKQLWDAVESSASIAGIMKSPDIRIDGQMHKGADGGFRNIVPIPDGKWDHIDVVPCTPLDRGNMAKLRQWNTLSLFARGVEVLEDEVFDKDYLQVGARLNPGGIMTIYAPRTDTGAPFEASREMINRRFEIGRDAYKNPETITYSQVCSLVGLDNEVVSDGL